MKYLIIIYDRENKEPVYRYLFPALTNVEFKNGKFILDGYKVYKWLWWIFIINKMDDEI